MELLAIWQQTRKVNNDELQTRVKSTIASWKSGKFMPLVCRPFSLNSYCLSKVWFRTHSVDLRVGDVTAITSACKGWLYQDMFEKPSELLLYRPVEDGGLGMHHVQCKALSSLISTFLQTAANPGYQQSLYHSLLYRRHCLLDDTVEIDIPPYYAGEFFSIIREVVENSPLNPVYMSVKQWYVYILEMKITMEKIDNEGRMKAKLCKVEEKYPNPNWQHIFQLSRLKGMSPGTKSFNFKLIHEILPCKARLSQFLPASSPLCNLCRQQVPETLAHALAECEKSMEDG